MGKKTSAAKSIESQVWQWAEKVVPNQITEDHILTSYRLKLPPCQNSKKNCQGNPRCVNGLGQSYWINSNTETLNEQEIARVQKEIDSEQRKQGELVGLKNLGATCYVNTYLQLWLHNVNFRNAIYSLNETDCDIKGNYQQTVCGQLQLVFGLLQGSTSKSIDPSSFIQSLGLPTDLQQDAQEFSKLFMGVLETNPTLSTVIHNQFCGKYEYRTKCLSCNTVTSRPSLFYELDLNIQGNKELKDCIKEFLKREMLCGDNQYHCDSCACKQDAVRQIFLNKLPQTLSLQLLRFVYDKNTHQRHKIVTSLSFPDTLDFSTILGNECNLDNSDLQYQLSAVLIHRGPSASSGHYIAHIKDTSDGNWYKFNDENVAKMKNGKKLDLGANKDEEDLWSELLPPSPKKQRLSKGYHSSKDVYMLVYLKTSSLGLSKACIPMPYRIRQMVEEHNLSIQQDAEARLESVCLEQSKSLAHRKGMQHFIESLGKESDDNEWMHFSVLKYYLNPNRTQKGVQKTGDALLCRHGNLNVDKVSVMKYIPKQAADCLYAECTDIPRPKLEVCPDCVQNRCLLIQKKHKLCDDYETVNQHLKSFKNTLDSINKCFYIGKISLRKWKSMVFDSIRLQYATKLQDAQSSSENSESEDFEFNTDVLCVHGNLSTGSSSYQLVPAECWHTLKSYFPNCVEFVENTDPCDECMSDIQVEELRLAQLKKMALEQKSDLHQLFLGKNRPNYNTLTRNQNPLAIYAVASKSLEKWREFLRQPTKNDPLTGINNQELLCKHHMLLYNPLDILNSSLIHEDLNQPTCELLWSEEWSTIQKHFSVDHTIKLSRPFTMDCSVVLCKLGNGVDNGSPSKKIIQPDNSQSKPPSVIIHSDTVKDATLNSSNRDKNMRSVVFNPNLCDICMQDLANEQKQKLYDFESADVYVHKVASSLIESQSIFPEKPTATEGKSSRRARRCTRGEKKLTEISSAMTLRDLKLKVMSIFSVPPFDQNLWLNGKLLVGDSSTLGNLLVYPNCTVTLIEDEPNPDNLPVVLEPVKEVEPERGFKGTGLMGF